MHMYGCMYMYDMHISACVHVRMYMYVFLNVFASTTYTDIPGQKFILSESGKGKVFTCINIYTYVCMVCICVHMYF